jgi:dehydrogenase/reductase SDR family member 12
MIGSVLDTAEGHGNVIGSALDTVLDRTVVIGYTNLGYRLRKHWWNPQDLQAMDGKVVLVTGATSGLGLATAAGFARLGATVWLMARDPQRGERARTQVAEQSAGGETHVGLCDLSDLESIRRFAGRFHAQSPRLDVLVNNAGVLAEQRTLSTDGIELTFATNVVGPFLLTNRLTPLLERSAPSRILNVSSGGMYAQRLRGDDLQSADGDYDGAAVYARTKRAQVILTELWAARLARSGVVVHAMHPGWVDTPGIRASLPRFYTLTKPFLRTPQQGADTLLWLGSAAEPGRSTGGFWHDRERRPTHLLPRTRETLADRARLWSECERLSG